MTFRGCRVVAFPLLLITPLVSSGAQSIPRFDAGAGAGGSAFGWQPQLGLGVEAPAVSLGSMWLMTHGSIARVDAGGATRSELLSGAKLSTAPGTTGWWIGTDFVRRTGLRDLIEQPRITAGGWRRIGPVTIGISASRRSARLTDVRHFTREILKYETHLDSISGQWDSVPRLTMVNDSTRTNGNRLWAETQGTLGWESGRWTAQLGAGGRLPTRDVPAGLWASGELAVRLGEPLSLVFGVGAAKGSGFLLDAEHRYLTLGFRLGRRVRSAQSATPVVEPISTAIGPLGVTAVSSSEYRLTLWALRARTVEVSGDFTNWKPVPLVRGDAGQWAVSVVLTPGTHRINARVDGGPWIVPPGLTTIGDDFAGTVGLLVIESGASARK